MTTISRCQLFLNKALHLLFLWQLQQILGDKKLIINPCQSKLNQRVVLMSTQKNSYGWIVILTHHALSVPAHIGIELTNVFMAELGKFQLNQHMAFQNTMIKNQIDKVVFIADQYSFLACFKAEAVPQFKEKMSFCFGGADTVCSMNFVFRSRHSGLGI